MSVTIYDVAKKSGVSISTVSRVLNNNPNVLEETRRKVLKVIADFNFKPSPIARGLVVKHTEIIEVFFSWHGYHFTMDSSWYIGLLNGINEVVQEHKYGLLINTIALVSDSKEVVRKVFRNAVDGILMVSPYLDEKEILKMLEERVPMVLVGYRAEDPRLDFVDSDNVNAAILAVDHLVKLGHKKIACITGEVKMSHNAADRLAGFLQAMKNHGLPVPTPYIVEGNFRKESGSAAMKNLLALPNRPTAVFVCNDTMAFSAIEAMEKAGLKAGKDIAIVGFDDVAEASLPLYSLTTLHQDFVGMGMEATRLLMEKIKRPQNWKPRQLLVPAQLVIRQSCGAKN